MLAIQRMGRPLFRNVRTGDWQVCRCSGSGAIAVDSLPSPCHDALNIPQAEPRMDEQEQPVILRRWTGKVPTERAEEYAKYMADTGFEEIENTEGNLGHQI